MGGIGAPPRRIVGFLVEWLALNNKGIIMATPKKRIYEVSCADDKLPTRLVRAQTRQQALAHVSKGTFTAVVPSQDRLMELAGIGVKAEEADADAE